MSELTIFFNSHLLKSGSSYLTTSLSHASLTERSTLSTSPWHKGQMMTGRFKPQGTGTIS